MLDNYTLFICLNSGIRFSDKSVNDKTAEHFEVFRVFCLVPVLDLAQVSCSRFPDSMKESCCLT